MSFLNCELSQMQEIGLILVTYVQIFHAISRKNLILIPFRYFSFHPSIVFVMDLLQFSLTILAQLIFHKMLILCTEITSVNNTWKQQEGDASRSTHFTQINFESDHHLTQVHVALQTHFLQF
jgi:hypothetical protein